MSATDSEDDSLTGTTTGDSSSYDSEESNYSEESDEEPGKKQVDTKNNDEDSDEFGFEESGGAGSLANKNMSSTLEDEAKTSYVKNAAYDEAIELGESSNSIVSTATAGVGAAKPEPVVANAHAETEKIKDAQYDEALELSDTQSSLNTVDESAGGLDHASRPARDTNRVLGMHHDEELELSSDTVNTVDTAIGEPNHARQKPDVMAEISESSDMSDSSSEMSDSSDVGDAGRDTPARKPQPSNAAATAQSTAAPTQPSAEYQRKKSFSSSSSSSSDSDTGEGKSTDINAYSNLNVSREITKLFDFIKAFKPTQHDLDSKIKCFIPDFIPSIGDMDPFLKIHRPDGKSDDLGLKILDEPHAHQSERTVLELQLRAQTKRSGMKEVQIQSIPNAAKNPAAIKAWIESMATLHLDKPLPHVTYKKPMPEIETLMQVWPTEFEEELNGMSLPKAEIDLTIKEYASVLCSLLDVPIYESTVQSLHVIFTLFAEFKANQHFQAVPDGDDSAAGGADTLELDSPAEDTKQNSGADSDDDLFNNF